MIKGIGVDIVDIGRFRKALDRWEGRFMERLFTGREREECIRERDPAYHLAVRFAAKEAFSKAVGTGFGVEVSPKSIEVVKGASGAPRLSLSDGAQRKMNELKATRSFLSLSHDKGVGIAFVILEDEDGARSI